MGIYGSDYFKGNAAISKGIAALQINFSCAIDICFAYALLLLPLL